MEFKLLCKNNFGIIITLILVILLNQTKSFNFLIDTYLGRLTLIGFIICCAYCNKIIGLMAILIVIMIFNQNDINDVKSYNYYEGFDVSGNITNDLTKKIKNNSNKNTRKTVNIKEEGREGFCMSDRELNILRGKQSNTLSILNNSRQQDNVMPSDKSVFYDLYTSFF